ncbi:Transcriptional regulator, MerR family [Brevibacterium aurantiacum]|uniref:Transcriptional regulator, MerR family n=1 Tax=Brevibacterium aurantiacum TaxID=273384 RepID=A0A1D7W3F2_BREAU|nr:Transcriptional regulator, MerR family [Brevibacterium aurantiacum]
MRAITELRALGFGLAEIGQLLDPQIGQSTLESLLIHQVDALQREITEASTRLVHVQHRLDIIQNKSMEIIMNLSLTALPSLNFWGLSTAVLDETEIGHAVSELYRRLPQSDEEIVLLYDGTRDDQITVSAGTMTQSESEAVSRIVVPEVPEGVTVTFDVPPESIADAWILIETELEKRHLTSFGVYRQVNSATGHVTLQAPVRERH